MFTAHVSGWSKTELLNTPVLELKRWHDEAINLHNQLNSPEEESKDGGQES